MPRFHVEEGRDDPEAALGVDAHGLSSLGHALSSEADEITLDASVKGSSARQDRYVELTRQLDGGGEAPGAAVLATLGPARVLRRRGDSHAPQGDPVAIGDGLEARVEVRGPLDAVRLQVCDEEFVVSGIDEGAPRQDIEERTRLGAARHEKQDAVALGEHLATTQVARDVFLEDPEESR